MPREPEAERSRNFDRFLTFVDAVVAIAITLLVLPLVDLASSLDEDGSVRVLLRHHFGELYAFVLSFVVIAALWRTHHHIVGDVLEESRDVTRWTMLWLFAIVVLPFPTALLSPAGSQVITKVFYMGTMIVASGALTGLRWVVDHSPELRDDNAVTHPQDFAQAIVRTSLFVLALLLALAIPPVGYWSLLVLMLTGPVSALVERVQARH